jgi:hypothetical protein
MAVAHVTMAAPIAPNLGINKKFPRILVKAVNAVILA